MNSEDVPLFCPLPKEADYSAELSAYLNKNVKELVTPEETPNFDFSLCIANLEAHLKCIAFTYNRFRGILKAGLRRKVF